MQRAFNIGICSAGIGMFCLFFVSTVTGILHLPSFLLLPGGGIFFLKKKKKKKEKAPVRTSYLGGSWWRVKLNRNYYPQAWIADELRPLHGWYWCFSASPPFGTVPISLVHKRVSIYMRNVSQRILAGSTHHLERPTKALLGMVRDIHS